MNATGQKINKKLLALALPSTLWGVGTSFASEKIVQLFSYGLMAIIVIRTCELKLKHKLAAIISGAALMISTLFLYTNPIDGEAILLIPKILWIYAVVAISSSKEEQYKKRQDKGISSVISFMTFYVAVSTILFGIILMARGIHH